MRTRNLLLKISAVFISFVFFLNASCYAGLSGASALRQPATGVSARPSSAGKTDDAIESRITRYDKTIGTNRLVKRSKVVTGIIAAFAALGLSSAMPADAQNIPHTLPATEQLLIVKPGEKSAKISISDIGITQQALQLPFSAPNPGKSKVGYPILDVKGNQGVPLGGIGTKVFTRTIDGVFANCMIGGRFIEERIPAEILVSQEQSGKRTTYATSTHKPADGSFSSFEYYPEEGRYSALFPFSQYDYPKFQGNIRLTQFSPFIPGNTRESSLPILISSFHVENNTDKDMETTVVFTWPNLLGWGQRAKGEDNSTWKFTPDSTGNYNRVVETDDYMGILFLREQPAEDSNLNGQMFLATPKQPGVEISYDTNVNAQSDGSKIWQPLSTKGSLSNDDTVKITGKDDKTAAAIAVKLRLQPGEVRDIPFVLTLDLPEDKLLSKRYNAYYTRFFGKEGKNAQAIAEEALKNYVEWTAKIQAWHKAISENKRLPEHLKTALINELYYVIAGGTIWDAETGLLAYLESPDYWNYLTTDVWFYSPMLAMLFPEQEKVIMKRLADLIPQQANALAEYMNPFPILKEDIRYILDIPADKLQETVSTLPFIQETGADIKEPLDIFRCYLSYEENIQLNEVAKKGNQSEVIEWIYDYYRRMVPKGFDPLTRQHRYPGTVKTKGAAVHDLGYFMTGEVTFTWQNTNRWKDLNTKFVLQVLRAYVLDGSQDKAFLEYCWPSVVEALEYARNFDKDGDFIPDNEGYPDQTYDTWKMKGISSYCGGLWLASLEAAIKIGTLLGDYKQVDEYKKYLEKGKAVFTKRLWNGEYFNIFSYKDKKGNLIVNNDIQADQLAWAWYTKMLDLEPLVPEEMVKKALRKIYDYNFRKFLKGRLGILNGMTASGNLIGTEQADEVWIGTNYGILALMHMYGMGQEADEIFEVLYKNLWQGGYQFMIPEALGRHFESKDMSLKVFRDYRAPAYMRAGAVWAIPLAMEEKDVLQQLSHQDSGTKDELIPFNLLPSAPFIAGLQDEINSLGYEYTDTAKGSRGLKVVVFDQTVLGRSLELSVAIKNAKSQLSSSRFCNALILLDQPITQEKAQVMLTKLGLNGLFDVVLTYDVIGHYYRDTYDADTILTYIKAELKQGSIKDEDFIILASEDKINSVWKYKINQVLTMLFRPLEDDNQIHLLSTALAGAIEILASNGQLDPRVQEKLNNNIQQLRQSKFLVTPAKIDSADYHKKLKEYRKIITQA